MSLDHAFAAKAMRAYEWGRARSAVWRAAWLTAAVTAIGYALVGDAALRWAPMTFAVWSLVWWRGGALLTGGRKGLVAGSIALLFPWSMLKTCCAPGAAMAADCCAQPGACSLVGVALGVGLSWFLPRREDGKPTETAAGMALGALSVAACRCASLCVGEALGIVGALGASLVVGGVATAVLARRRSALR